MMHVDDHLANLKGAQACQRHLQQGAAADFHQRLGTIVGERPQTGAQAGGQNHGFHLPSFSSSIWRITTLIPLRARRCFANSSARYTERCWPPVQPNETIRLSKPRRWYSLTLASTNDVTLARN